jgi:hypothetical protein
MPAHTDTPPRRSAIRAADIAREECLLYLLILRVLFLPVKIWN